MRNAMDTTQKYVKMCIQAIDIQNNHKPEAWDYYWASYENDPPEIFVISGYTTDCGYYGIGINDIEQEDYNLIAWLPRQDQLQDMVKRTVWFETLYRFYEWINKHSNSDKIEAIFENLTTMEQLWLAFVMHENFKKIWSETEQTWVIVNE